MISTLRFLTVACCCIVLILAESACSQEWIRTRDHHAWARFEKQSWKTTKILTDLVDEAGNITSTVRRETTTRLLEANETDFILGVESTVQIGEQKVNHSNHKIKRNINVKGEGFSKTVDTGTLKIGEQEFNVEIQLVTLQTKQGKRVSRLTFCKDTMPHVLKRVTTFYDKKAMPVYTTTSQVTSFDVKRDILGEEQTVCRIVTNHSENGTTSVTNEIYCAKVPGGIVSQKIIEKNADDQIVRRTTLELIDYAIGKQESKRPKKDRPEEERKRDPPEQQATLLDSNTPR